MDQSYIAEIVTAFGVPAEHYQDLLNPKKSSSDVIPENYQNELIMLRERKRDIYFRIGDIANELILMHKGTVSAKKVYESMSPYCDCSPRTIRYYAENSSFFEDHIRDMYEVVPFSHFDVARSFKEQWLFVLDLSAENVNWSAQRLSDTAKKAITLHKEEKNSAGKTMCDSVLKFGSDSDTVIIDENSGNYTVPDEVDMGILSRIEPYAPPEMNSARLIGSIADLSEVVIQLIENYGERLPKPVKDKLIEHIVGINREIPAITIALDVDGAK